MKTSILLTAAAGAALTLSAPAFAQDLTPAGATPPVAGVTTSASVAGNGNWTLSEREHWVDEHINKAHDEKDIDGREADRAHHELDRIRDNENQMRSHHDGGQLTDNETTMLEARLDDMAARIHWAHEQAYQKPW